MIPTLQACISHKNVCKVADLKQKPNLYVSPSLGVEVFYFCCTECLLLGSKSQGKNTKRRR